MAETLGDRIHAARKAKGLTQDELASKIGVSSRWLREYESGRFSNPSLAVMEKLSSALGLSLDDLVQPKAPDTAEASS